MTKGAADPRQRFLRLAASVRHHREQIARVVDEARHVREEFGDREPPRLELRGIGGIVHDFYTGIEHLFESIAPELNGGLPAGESWDRDLLENMTLTLPGVRPPLLRRDPAHALAEFLRFRHLFRNLYGFELEWPRLRTLLERLPDAWERMEADIERFLAFLDKTAEGPAPNRGGCLMSWPAAWDAMGPVLSCFRVPLRAPRHRRRAR